MNQDTIAAISTGMTNSGIGIVRISGSEALEIADRVYKGKETITEVPTHTIHYGHVMDGDETVDEVLVMVMRGPRTFTGEDTVEINCHGGTYVVSRVLETVLKAGARPAEPGEFTKRAFLNGKMDLSQAEAVIDVITSENEYALQSSISQLKGSVKNRIKEIREKIIYHTAFIETALDDPEHISLEGYPEQLAEKVTGFEKEIQKLLATADNGRLMKEGISTVIVGKPNAGKSSLLNMLLGEDRAIVTEIAGTTRDALHETINLHGISLNMIDTAGIHETQDVVEKVERFFDTVNQSYLIELLSHTIKEGRVISLIHKYLYAGVMVNGVYQPTTEGTPQGGPLSPLLSNIVDKELERRGHPFVRYADDSLIFCKTKMFAIN